MEKVSTISCCRNEIRHIRSFLRSLDLQLRDGFELEAILADGGSFDGTRAILDDFATRRPWVRVIDNHGRIASTGLNAAIRASCGSVVIRMDAHTEYAENYVATCIAVLHRTHAAMVGGPMRMARGSYWQNAIGLAYPATFFSGGSRVYDVEYEGKVDSVLYGCWPRAVLEKAGLFDETMVRNQDDELSLRIPEAGGIIWQSPEIRCWYHPRTSPLALARQFFGYGFWKGYTMRKHREVVRLRHLAPGIAVASLGVLICGALASRRNRFILLAACSAYAAVAVLASVALIKRSSDLRLLPGLAVVFPCAHLAYGSGTLLGFLRLRVNP